MAVAVLDVGKTNVKVDLFEDGRLVFERSAQNRVLPGPPYPHLDVETIFAFFLASLREAVAAHRIDDIVVTAHGATATVVGEVGLALPVMDYEFAGIDDIEPDYAPFRPPFEETLSPPLTAGLNYGRMLFYLKRRHPEEFGKARHILMYPQYFTWRLTGATVNEATSLGCHGDLWRPVEGRPSSLAERLGWGPLLPKVVRAYDFVGEPKRAIVSETGLAPGTRVRAGIHDSNASILPHLLTIDPPFTVVSTGTWVVIMAIGADAKRLDPQRDMLGNVDVEGRPVPSAKFMGGREYSVILDGASATADLDDLAAVLASGAMALPSFAPNGGPFARKAGEVTGTLPARVGARAALAALYETLMTDYVLDLLGADRGPLAVEGSFARNRLYGTVLATLRPDQPVLISIDGAGTAYGASLLATWPEPPLRDSPRTESALPDSGALLRYRSAWRSAVSNG